MDAEDSILWGFLDGAVLFKVQKLALDSLQRIGELSFLQFSCLQSDPAQQIGGQSFVVRLTLIGVHQFADDLQLQNVIVKYNYLSDIDQRLHLQYACRSSARSSCERMCGNTRQRTSGWTFRPAVAYLHLQRPAA